MVIAGFCKRSAFGSIFLLDEPLVMVNYKKEYFPGQMKDICKNNGKTMTKYQVTVMAMSGPNDW